MTAAEKRLDFPQLKVVDLRHYCWAAGQCGKGTVKR